MSEKKVVVTLGFDPKDYVHKDKIREMWAELGKDRKETLDGILMTGDNLDPVRKQIKITINDVFCLCMDKVNSLL